MRRVNLGDAGEIPDRPGRHNEHFDHIWRHWCKWTWLPLILLIIYVGVRNPSWPHTGLIQLALALGWVFPWFLGIFQDWLEDERDDARRQGSVGRPDEGD